MSTELMTKYRLAPFEPYLDRIPLRPLPLDYTTSFNEASTLASWLNLTITAEEFEQERLIETPANITERLEDYLPLTVSGQYSLETDHLDRLARYCAHSGLIVQEYTLSGLSFTLTGLCQKEDLSHFTELFQDVLSKCPKEDCGEVFFTVPTTQLHERTNRISSIIENIRIGLELEGSPVEFSVHRDRSGLSFRGKIEGMSKALQEYYLRYQGFHSAFGFWAFPEQEPEAILPYLLQKLEEALPLQFTQITELSVLYLPKHRCLLRYRSSHYELYEQVDLLLTTEYSRFLDENYRYRYFTLKKNALTPVWFRLEDLIPVSIEGTQGIITLYSPLDRSLQLTYAQIVGYSTLELLEDFITRQKEFFSQGTMTRSFQQYYPLEEEEGLLHFIGKHLPSTNYSLLGLRLTLQKGLLTLSGKILALKDFLALYLLFLNCQYALQASPEVQNSLLKVLDDLSPDTLPSELLELLYQNSRYCLTVNQTLSTSTSGKSYYYRLPIIEEKATLPLQEEMSKVLGIPLDLAYVEYLEEGLRQRAYSVRAPANLDPSTLGSLLSKGPALNLLPDTIEGQLYRLDVAQVQDYYRIDVVEVIEEDFVGIGGLEGAGLAGIDRFTLCYFPLWALFHDPLYLDKLLRKWNLTKLLSKEGKLYYRLTRRLYGELSVNEKLRPLTPDYYARLSLLEIRQLLQKILED